MHKISMRSSLAAILLTLGLVVVVISRGNTSGAPIALPISSSLQSGDILLLEGTSFRGHVVRFLNSKSDFSHVGVVKIEAGKAFLLHADPKLGCVQEEMAELFHRCCFKNAIVLRPKNAAAALKAVTFCSQVVTRHTGFNDSFRYLQGSGYYCTELVLLAYESAKSRLLEGVQKGAIIFPEQLLNSHALVAQVNS